VRWIRKLNQQLVIVGAVTAAGSSIRAGDFEIIDRRAEWAGYRGLADETSRRFFSNATLSSDSGLTSPRGGF
jgi:hypothetical protein